MIPKWHDKVRSHTLALFLNNTKLPAYNIIIIYF